jgi:23S rRNA (cytosine1962-C5)-methyltransferase
VGRGVEIIEQFLPAAGLFSGLAPRVKKGVKKMMKMPLIQTQSTPPVRLDLSRDLTRSLRRGHPWVFADALKQTPEALPGAHASLSDRRGKPIARGFYDPRSPLAFRACTVTRKGYLDDTWAEAQLQAAVQLREALIDTRHTTGFRLVNGEGDGLPGLVIDIYGDTAVLKLDGPAPEGFWDAQGVGEWVAERLTLSRVYQRDRTRTGPEGRPLVGSAPDAPVAFLEHGLHFEVDVVRGQKTGFFLDQRENRQLIRTMASGRRTLNVFGYTGGFSVYAGAGGATAVTTVDIAKPAIAASEANMTLNGLSERHEAVAEDAFVFLDNAAESKRSWDLVILDPPSFAPNRQSAERAGNAYERLITAGASVTAPGGLLAAASCSSHVGLDAFTHHVENGVGGARRRATVLGIHQQPADHPTPLPLQDFRYLKMLLLRLD